MLEVFEQRLAKMTIEEIKQCKQEILEALDKLVQIETSTGSPVEIQGLPIRTIAEGRQFVELIDISLKFLEDDAKDAKMNTEIQRYVVETAVANGIRVFAINRYMWDYPDLEVEWRDGEIKKFVAISLNGKIAEITGSASLSVKDSNGDPIRRRFRDEEIGVCDYHDLITARDILWKAFRRIVQWIEADLPHEELL